MRTENQSLHLISLVALKLISIFAFGEAHAFEKSSLEWPLDLPPTQIRLGDSLNQFVGNDEHGYFHGGCDLVVPAGTRIKSPVTGHVAISFYYVDSSPTNGHVSTKRIPFSKDPAMISKYRLTTEIAVILDDGGRIEFHHVDPFSIPEPILNLASTNGRVKRGEILGSVIQWPLSKLSEDYSHVHYNIYEGKTGLPLNCQYYSIKLPDQTPPLLSKVLLKYQNRIVPFVNGSIVEKPNEIYVQAQDQTDNSPFLQAPVVVGLRIDEEKTAWDFRRGLFTQDGVLPELRDVYAFLLDVDGVKYSTVSDYWSISHVFRLKVHKIGKFEIFAEDIYGNRSMLTGEFK